MIKDALSSEIVKASLFGLEFKTNKRKRFSIDHADGRECTECLGGILQDFIVHRSVTCVYDLYSLVN
jgi:hypothetical protein